MLAPMQLQQCNELQTSANAFEEDVRNFAERFSATSPSALPFKDVTTFDVSGRPVIHVTLVPLASAV